MLHLLDVQGNFVDIAETMEKIPYMQSSVRYDKDSKAGYNLRRAILFATGEQSMKTVKNLQGVAETLGYAPNPDTMSKLKSVFSASKNDMVRFNSYWKGLIAFLMPKILNEITEKLVFTCLDVFYANTSAGQQEGSQHRKVAFGEANYTPDEQALVESGFRAFVRESLTVHEWVADTVTFGSDGYVYVRWVALLPEKVKGESPSKLRKHTIECDISIKVMGLFTTFLTFLKFADMAGIEASLQYLAISSDSLATDLVAAYKETEKECGKKGDVLCKLDTLAAKRPGKTFLGPQGASPTW